MANPIEEAAAIIESCDFMQDPSKQDNMDDLKSAMLEIRKALSSPQPDIDAAIACGMPKKVSHILGHATNEDLLFETLWVATNIASGKLQHTQALLTENCHEHAVTLLTHPVLAVGEQAAWCVGNIAGDGPALRDILLQMRCSNGSTLIEQLIHQYKAISQEEARLNKSLHESKGVMVWVLSNLCRGKPQPDISLIEPCFPFLRNVLKEAIDPKHKDILLDALWCVAYISDGENERIQLVLNNELLGLCIERLLLPRRGPMASHKDNTNTDDLLEGEVYGYRQSCNLPLEQLAEVFEYLPVSSLRKAAFGCRDWMYDVVLADVHLHGCLRAALTGDPKFEGVILRILGNVVTGDEKQTQSAIDLGFLDVVEQICRRGAKPKVKKELCWSLSNVTAGSKAQIRAVLERRALANFILDCLEDDDDVAVAREATWVVANACSGLVDDFSCVVSNGLFFNMLLACDKHDDPKMLRCGSEALECCIKGKKHLRNEIDLSDEYKTTARKYLQEAVEQPSRLHHCSAKTLIKSHPDAFENFDRLLWSVIIPKFLFQQWGCIKMENFEGLHELISRVFGGDENITLWVNAKTLENPKLIPDPAHNQRPSTQHANDDDQWEDVEDSESEGDEDEDDDDEDEEEDDANEQSNDSDKTSQT